MNPAVTTNLAQLEKALGLYQVATGLSFEEVLAKKATDLSFRLRNAWRALMPAKGKVRAERLAGLSQGVGVHVRPSAMILAKAAASRYRAAGPKSFWVDGKKLNIQAIAVRREIGLRESGRGFVGQAARFSPDPDQAAKAEARSRVGPQLAEADLIRARQRPEGAQVTMTWGPYSELSQHATAGILKPRGEAAAAEAVEATMRDIVPYLERHLGVLATRVGLS